MHSGKIVLFLMFFVILIHNTCSPSEISKGSNKKDVNPREGTESKKLNIHLDEYTNYFISPLITEDYIMFLVTNNAKKVEIVGDFTSWKREKMLYEEKLKIWYYVWTKSLSKGDYRYKLVIDDVFVYDPLNQLTKPDGKGGFYSILKLDNDFEVLVNNPKKVSNNYYEFVYKDLKASKVILVGSFNNWNPYQYEMGRNKGGIWKITIYLPKGIYYYYFIVDDEITSDPLNYNTAHDKFGNTINFFEVN